MLTPFLIVQLFVLLNPLTAAPFLLTLHKRGINVRSVAASAVLTAFIVAIVIALVGTYLFDLFGITQHSFRVAGGIVILLLGLETIRGQDDEVPEKSGLDNFIAILATPILTGPATMSFITLKAFEIGPIKVIVHVLLAFIGVAGVMYLLCVSLDKLNARLIGIVSRILGLFLTAMAVEMIAKGLEGLIKAAG